MNKEEQKILNDSLSKLFKIDPETLASLYNEAGDLINFSPILKLDADRIQKYKDESDNQYKRGIKEGASKIEKAVKEKYSIESDLLGVDLIDHLMVTKVDEAKTAGTKDVTKHPDYIKLQIENEKALKKRDEDWQLKLDARDAEIKKAQLFEKVSKYALTWLKSKDPILPVDPRKAQTWQDTFVNDLKSGNYMENNDLDEIIVLDGDKKAKTNVHGKRITFDEHIADIADKYFEFPVSQQRSSAGNLPPGQPAGLLSGFKPPKNEEERLELLRDIKITPKQRKELTEYVIK